MTWTRLSDDFCDRPDLLGCSRSARLLFVELLVYANRLELDGKIPAAQLPRFTDGGDEELRELIAADLVFVTSNDIIVVDWSDQEPAERVKQRRKVAAEKQARYRDRQAAHAGGDHRLCDPRFCPLRDNETGNETGGVTVSRPYPSRPQQGQGQDGEAGAGEAAPTCLKCNIGGGQHAVDCEYVA